MTTGRPPASGGTDGVHVVLDARFIGFAGIGRWVDGIWRGLVESGVRVTGLWPAGRPRDWMGSRRPAPAGPHLTLRTRPFSPAEQLVLPAVTQRAGANIYHAPNWAVPYLTRQPVVLTVHDLYPYLDPSIARSRLTATVYRTVIPLSVRKARRLVAVSNLAARQLRETFNVGDDRLSVVEHGIDHDRWQGRPESEIAEARSRYGLPSDYLLYVGTVKPHKNLKTLLAAHRPEHPTLVLAGPTAEELERALGSEVHSSVIAIGRVQDELPALYSGAMALLVPSLYESVSFPALEAMACGTPLVCSDGGGLPETAGDAGIVLPVTDVAAWREALTMVSEQESLRARLSAAGIEHVRRRSWQRAAGQYLEIYREALG